MLWTLLCLPAVFLLILLTTVHGIQTVLEGCKGQYLHSSRQVCVQNKALLFGLKVCNVPHGEVLRLDPCSTRYVATQVTLHDLGESALASNRIVTCSTGINAGMNMQELTNLYIGKHMRMCFQQDLCHLDSSAFLYLLMSLLVQWLMFIVLVCHLVESLPQDLHFCSV